MRESITPLERFRTELELTQDRLAELAGVSRDVIWALETRRRQPRRITLVRLAKALGVAVDDLFEDDAA